MIRCIQEGCKSWGEYDNRCFQHSIQHDADKKLGKREVELRKWIDQTLGGDFSEFSDQLIARLHNNCL